MAIRHKDDLAMTDVELSTLKVNSYNKPDRLPDDLVELKQFIEDKMDTDKIAEIITLLKCGEI